MPEAAAAAVSGDGERAGTDPRLKRAVLEHSSFVYRTLLRFGVRTADAEDASQEVYLVLARRLADVPGGSEKGFLFRTAIGVASTRRRSDSRRAEQFDGDFDARPGNRPDPEELVTRLKLRKTLQLVLDELEEDQRTVFVLVELEGLSAPDVSRLLDVPLGTVASRLRRARSAFLLAMGRLNVERDLKEYAHD